MISNIAERKIPLILLNGVFRTSYSPFYHPILTFCLSCFEKLYVVDATSKTALQKMDFASEVLADTRFDRMQVVKDTPFDDEKTSNFLGKNPCLIMGSTWTQDEELLLEILPYFPKIKVIIAPHEIHTSRMEALKSRFSQALFYSQYSGERTQSQILIIDSIGILSKLYRYGTVNYVGGGFNKVVHSLLEPMAYGKPIVIGPNIEKSAEAQRFVKENWVTKIENAISFQHALQEYLYQDNTSKNEARAAYFESHLGSVSKIINAHILK
jgi:3-deoxy-D-manno-octulosonic-acid transferase